mgnify:FL=1
MADSCDVEWVEHTKEDLIDPERELRKRDGHLSKISTILARNGEPQYEERSLENENRQRATNTILG